MRQVYLSCILTIFRLFNLLPPSKYQITISNEFWCILFEFSPTYHFFPIFLVHSSFYFLSFCPSTLPVLFFSIYSAPFQTFLTQFLDASKSKLRIFSPTTLPAGYRRKNVKETHRNGQQGSLGSSSPPHTMRQEIETEKLWEGITKCVR